MLSGLKKSKRKLINIIVIAFISYFIINCIATKLIYDISFGRCDTPNPYSYAEFDKAKQPAYEEEYFYSGKNRLYARLYPCDSADTLVVLAVGYTASVDDYIPQIAEFHENSLAVFAFDPTGSFHSEGDSSVGFPQELLDLNCALSHIEKKDEFGYKNIALFGHSRGGYSVLCAEHFGHKIDCIISVSAVNTSMDAIMAMSVAKAGIIAYPGYPFLWGYQNILFGTENANLSADAVVSSGETPTLIIHGQNDDRIPLEGYSAYCKKDSITNKNAEFLLCTDNGSDGHTSLLFDKDGRANKKLMSIIIRFINNNTNHYSLQEENQAK